MTIKDLGTNMDRQWRNDLNDNFRELSGMQGFVSDAVNKAKTAEQIANEANNTSSSVQKQLDTIVIEKGQSDAEVLQARTDKDGKTYTTLKSMNDAQQKKTETWSNDLVGRGISITNPPPPIIAAKGDGVTNDRPAFLGVLEALKLIGGGILFVPPSTEKYVVDNQVEWNETYGHLTILGAGRGSHVYLSKKSTNGHLFGAIGSGSSEVNWISAVTFKDIQVSTYSGTSTQDDNPIGVAKAKNVLFENVYISFSNWKGITVQTYARNITFKNCEVANCRKSGISTEFSTVSDIKVLDCVTHHNGEQGAIFTSAGDGGYVKGIKVNGLNSFENALEGITFSGIDGGESLGLNSHNNRGEGVKTYNCKNFYAKGISEKNNLSGVRSVLGIRNTFEFDSRNNSISDPDNRGNFFIESTPNTKLINCIGNEGVRSITNWSENVDIENCSFAGTTLGILATTIAQETQGKTNNYQGNRTTYGDSAPIAGTFKRSDIRQFLSVSPNGTQGMICTTAGKAHKVSNGVTTTGSNQITNVTNVDTWLVGDLIKGNGIPAGTKVTAILDTTLTISNSASSDGMKSLYDAVFNSYGNISS